MKTIKKMGTPPPPPVPDHLTVHDQLIEAIKTQHPEWVQADGDCPACREYGARLAENFRESEYQW